MNSFFTKISFTLFTLTCSLQNFAQAPVNNACAAATTIFPGIDCINGTSKLVNQTLTAATADGYTIASACGQQANARDIWYKFTARSKYPTITSSNYGSAWGAGSNFKIQILSGTCGATSLTEVACADSVLNVPVATPLTEGTTYFVRIHKNISTTIGANHTFDLCITDLTRSSRLKEIFTRTVLSNPQALQYPWEITYGPDDSLWITEAKGYKAYKMHNSNGGKRVVLDLSFGSTWFGATGTGGADTLYAQESQTTWNNAGAPQGGFAGLALHPQFGLGAGKDFVYITYVWKYLSGTNPDGRFYQSKLVRFTYNSSTGRLQSPAVLEWNLPGSSDHNSQRLIINPVIKNGTAFLFLAVGDMGGGQYFNRYRANKSQDINSLEGKTLRYNLESDNGTTGDTGNNQWIPNDNPYNALLGSQSAIWNIGMRNNQGFAYDTASNILYGSSHGPYSDDEINVIKGFKNYGHPLIVGYAADGNYNGSSTSGSSTGISTGAPFSDDNAGLWYVPSGYTPPASYTSPYNGKSSVNPVGNENNNKIAINADVKGQYEDPIFSGYPSTNATILNTWQNGTGNGGWESEGWSGLDLYSNSVIPGWKKSLINAGLKWGRLIKLNLGTNGLTTMPSNVGSAVGNAGDTVTYFQSSNRYRDLAISPNGKNIFLVMDNTSSTSGPGTSNPSAAACPGCVIKYTFLGYENTATGLSTLPKTINVAQGTVNTCVNGNTITIDGSNNFLWVPITGPDGNIIAEINAMGQNLGNVTTSFYTKATTGGVRSRNGIKYLDRNITITPTVTTFATPVKVRLYITKAEFDALKNDLSSGVITISDLKVSKNNDVCGNAIASNTTALTTVNSGIDLEHGTNGFVIQTAVSSFSTFYFSGSSSILPIDGLKFTAKLQNDLSAKLIWETDSEAQTIGFDLERSINATSFTKIGFVAGAGQSNTILNYNYSDLNAAKQESPIIYYRLKWLNLDGTFKYSSIAKVDMPIATTTIDIAPNPVKNEMNGKINSGFTGNATLSIYDLTGRILQKQTIILKKGINSFTQNVSGLAAGSYYLSITSQSINGKSKFQKL
jgi:trimeric autotransporter adhesin